MNERRGVLVAYASRAAERAPVTTSLQQFTTRPVITGGHGVVAAGHYLAATIGLETLTRGGNAVDAGVAAGFALNVLKPHMAGIGGEAPILIYKDGRVPPPAFLTLIPPPRSDSVMTRTAAAWYSAIPASGASGASANSTSMNWPLLVRRSSSGGCMTGITVLSARRVGLARR